MQQINKLANWSVPGQTQTANTAILIPIPPYAGQPGTGPFLYGLDSQGNPNWWGVPNGPGAVTHVTRFGISTGSTANISYFMRPLNWAKVTTAGAKNTTSFIVDKDPGIYSASGLGSATNYRNKAATAGPGGVPAAPTVPVTNMADDAMTTNDYYCVQLADGTWFFDKCAGVAGTPGPLTVTTTTTIPNVTGNSIPVGAIMFWFGVQTDLDPATGLGHPAFNPKVSVYTEFGDPCGDGIVSTLRPGEPIYFLDPNATAAETVAFISGYYAPR